MFFTFLTGTCAPLVHVATVRHGMRVGRLLGCRWRAYLTNKVLAWIARCRHDGTADFGPRWMCRDGCGRGGSRKAHQPHRPGP
eukprot:8722108-Pyramimonas_sp.AAC.1